MSSEKSRAEPVWSRTAPGSRKPAYSRELIVETAIRIADTEGFEAVSMRRIAAELGAGTMTIYHYVATKDELLVLIGDAIMAEILIPDDEVPDNWRDGMAALARRTLAMFVNHGWIVEHLDEGDAGSMGPNVLRHVEQSMAIASLSGLPVEAHFELSGVVDDYVFGHAIRMSKTPQFGTDGAPDERLNGLIGYMTSQLGSGHYPHLEAIAGDDPAAGFARLAHLDEDPERFERGLQRVLDGLEIWVNQARKAKK